MHYNEKVPNITPTTAANPTPSNPKHQFPCLSITSPLKTSEQEIQAQPKELKDSKLHKPKKCQYQTTHMLQPMHIRYFAALSTYSREVHAQKKRNRETQKLTFSLSFERLVAALEANTGASSTSIGLSFVPPFPV